MNDLKIMAFDLRLRGLLALDQQDVGASSILTDRTRIGRSASAGNGDDWKPLGLILGAVD
ncbi:MAG: hypothetical protein Q9160_008349 [Pyrenula sp. 1 TL-2023]